MRTLLTLACVAALGGCAIIVAPNGEDVRVHTAFSSDSVTGNNMPARDERVVDNLPGIDVGGSMVVDVRVGPSPSLVVEADSNLLPLIRTEASGGKLVISTTGSYRTSNPIHIIYTVPRLTELRVHGAGRLHAVGLDGSPLKLRQSGSGTVELEGEVSNLDAQLSGSARLDAARLRARSANLAASGSTRLALGELRGDFANVSVHGSATVSAGGQVRALTVRAHGAGAANLDRLESEQADLMTSGAGAIGATVRQSLVAQGSGGGGIRVYGRPPQRTINGSHVSLID